MFKTAKLTNLKLSHFSGEHVHYYGVTGPVAVYGLDNEVDLLAGRQTCHGKLRRQTGDVSEVFHGETVQHLQQEDLLQSPVKARDAGDL